MFSLEAVFRNDLAGMQTILRLLETEEVIVAKLF